MTFPFKNLLGVSIASVRYLDLCRVTLCMCSCAPSLFVAVESARSKCHVIRHYPILFQLSQGQLIVITAVNSLLTSKGFS